MFRYSYCSRLRNLAQHEEAELRKARNGVVGRSALFLVGSRRNEHAGYVVVVVVSGECSIISSAFPRHQNNVCANHCARLIVFPASRAPFVLNETDVTAARFTFTVRHNDGSGV